MKRFADRASASLSATFDAMYGTGGRPSIPPERLLKASLLISLYSVRGERAFCEEIDFQLLWRWFLDMSLMEPSFDQSTFSKNRGRLLRHVVAQQFFDEVVRQADALDRSAVMTRSVEVDVFPSQAEYLGAPQSEAEGQMHKCFERHRRG
jgi:transposase